MQQSQFWVFIQNNWSRGLEEIQALPHSLQHYSQYPRCGSKLNIQPWMDRWRQGCIYTMERYPTLKKKKMWNVFLTMNLRLGMLRFNGTPLFNKKISGKNEWDPAPQKRVRSLLTASIYGFPEATVCEVFLNQTVPLCSFSGFMIVRKIGSISSLWNLILKIPLECIRL